MRTKHTKLLEWLKTADDEAVNHTGTTRAYLRQIAYGNKTATPQTAVVLEQAGLATRKELRPEDWRSIWPELDSTAEQHPPIRQAS